jgi:hypothetical protein
MVSTWGTHCRHCTQRAKRINSTIDKSITRRGRMMNESRGTADGTTTFELKTPASARFSKMECFAV